MNFDIVCKMALYFGKTAFMVAYDLRLKTVLYENVSVENFTSDFSGLCMFNDFLDS
jgi:hypothetical protein